MYDTANGICTDNYEHTHTQNCFTALWILFGTTWVSRYQKKHSPTHTHRGHQISLYMNTKSIYNAVRRICWERTERHSAECKALSWDSHRS